MERIRSILKGKCGLLQEIRDLRQKNAALLKKNIELRDRLSQVYSLRKGDNARTEQPTRTD